MFNVVLQELSWLPGPFYSTKGKFHFQLKPLSGNDSSQKGGKQLKNSSQLYSPENTNRTERPEEPEHHPEKSRFWIETNLGPGVLQIM